MKIVSRQKYDRLKRVFKNSPRRTRRAQRLEKTRKNLRKSVQSVAESFPRERVNQGSMEYQNTLLKDMARTTTNPRAIWQAWVPPHSGRRPGGLVPRFATRHDLL